MGDLKKIDLSIAYETSDKPTDLIEKFYIPVLSEATSYLRIAGFFNSSSLSIAAKGIEGLVYNGGTMKMLISPEISEEDFEVLKNTNDKSLYFKNMSFDEFEHDEHLKLLAWLLANDKLEIRVVLNKISHDSLFHIKVGIVFDEYNNMLSFSGSNNETASAWLRNIEEFKVFKAWVSGQELYAKSDFDKFVSYWNNEHKNIAETFQLPDSIKKKIIRFSPKNVNDLNIMREFVKREKNLHSKFKPFDHQSRAIELWNNNNRRLLMEMATGTGKTRTALGCALEMVKNDEKFIMIVATPQGTLSRQWRDDMENIGLKFDYNEILDGSKPWRIEFEKFLIDMNRNQYKNAAIFSTHKTISDSDFINLIKKYKDEVKILFVCDEVHNIGSDKQRSALIDEYDYRIGLSATPERLFDEEGSTLIRDYFGNKSFEFTIHDALTNINPATGKHFLNSFSYYPVFVDLNEEELQKYKNVSRNIIVLTSQDTYDQNELAKLLERRARIIKNAEAKKGALKQIISHLSSIERIKDTLIFVSDEQRDFVMEYLSQININREKITIEESAYKKTQGELTERQEIISNFKNGSCQILIGLKCLDEGIDIPNARIAILMSSSINPREYIQRVGRVIRQAPNKKESMIFDIIVNPSDDSKSSDSVLRKEARRALLIAKNATNYKTVMKKFKDAGWEDTTDADK